MDMALNNPFQAFGRKELYPSIQAKAARLCFGLVKNHAMLDGNKRLGTHVMLVFLALNGYELSYSQKELCDVILAEIYPETINVLQKLKKRIYNSGIDRFT